MTTYDPIEAGRMEITLSAAGEWIVAFDGKEQARTLYPEQVRRECSRLFLANTVRRNSKGAPLNQYRVAHLPRGLVNRLSRALDAHMTELMQQAQHRDVAQRIMRQPSSLQRHWHVLS